MDKDQIITMLQSLLKQFELDVKMGEAQPALHGPHTMGVLEGKVAAIEIALMRIEDADDSAAYRENMDENDTLPPQEKWVTPGN